MYRHLLFNKLGREDGRFDVSLLPSHTLNPILALGKERKTWLITSKALHHPPRHPAPPLRRLPHLGPYREALLPTTPPAPAQQLKLFPPPCPSVKRHSRVPHATPPPAIPLLPSPRLPVQPRLPPPHPHPLCASPAQPPARPRAPRPALPARERAVDGAAGVQLHEVVSHLADHLGV